MKTVLKDSFIDGYIEQGLAKGRAQGEAQMLLRIMTARGIAVPEHVRLRVTECTDTAQLEAWFDRAITATTMDEIFSD